jgi:hypothetical protein
MKPEKVAFILGDWSRNIGNSYFQLGGYHVIKKVLPDAKVAIICEQPGYPSYWNPKGGNPRNYFDMASEIDADAIVLMGPMFRPEMNKVWAASLERIFKRGTRLILLGVACMNYEPQNIELYREFLTRFPPYILTSRDTRTYELLGNLAEHSMDGIDCAYFMPDVYSPVGFRDLQPYIVLNFDKTPEPHIRTLPKTADVPPGDGISFEFNDLRWVVEGSNFRSKMARRSRYFSVLEGILFPGSQVSQLGDYKVVRTDHRPHPMLSMKTYRSPNMMVNDTPYPYVELYSHADLLLSDRLHACIMALSYGRPAMLMYSSARFGMLERLGLADITKHPVMLDQAALKLEKEKLLSFLKEWL